MKALILSLSGLLLAGAFGTAASIGRTQTDRAPACRASQLAISPGPDITPKTGQNPLAVRLTNRGHRSCLLDGYPTIALTDARGVLPFRIRRGGDTMITSRRPRPVTVRPGGRAYTVINKYRCDRGSFRVARSLRLGLSGAVGAKHLLLRIPHRFILGYCGRGDPGSIVATSPFEPRVGAALA